MNRKTAILTATFVVFGLSACTPTQVKQFLAATHKPAPTVVNHQPTVASTLPRNGATVTTIVDIGDPVFPVLNPAAACGESGALACSQPATPPTTVYTGPARMQCENGSFAPQGDCPATPVEQLPATVPQSVQCKFGNHGPQEGCEQN